MLSALASVFSCFISQPLAGASWNYLSSKLLPLDSLSQSLFLRLGEFLGHNQIPGVDCDSWYLGNKGHEDSKAGKVEALAFGV